LTTENQDLEFILPTFESESIAEFEEFVQENQEKKFVEKNIWNRGVKVIDKEKIDFKSEDKIYQVFMDKPMLIDDRAFDMGIYVLISSINPLRVYRYDSEMLMRFCPEPYYPFNASNVNQYVIFENHKHYSELPSFKKYADNFGYSLKHIYENYLREKRLEPSKMWKQIDEIIATVIARNEDYFVDKVFKFEIFFKIRK
jgi:tubulin monoglycylase TTLL15